MRMKRGRERNTQRESQREQYLERDSESKSQKFTGPLEREKVEKLKKEEKETLRGSQGVECYVWYKERKKNLM